MSRPASALLYGIQSGSIGGKLGYEVSALGVAKIYDGLVDLFVLDEQDRDLAPKVEALGMRTLVTDTMMTSMERKAELAREVVAAARGAR